ncbi:hypothetical protein FAZ69_01455 [Trinickia terrae]|uniref:QacE n=1 Tax=Trinickia terrae TaxID=2571161 RepID=A0A4U1IF76_9BURK|nr:DUF6232 family protein [Trinickia terrae]TKC92374.1 hypothetical protein FAZ69_01455 [Trinickia terrae]
MDNAFNERGVTITRNGLSAAGQVFALREIHRTRIVTIQKNKALPLTLSLIGLAGAVAGGIFRSGAGLTLGVMMFVVGVLAWFTQDITHRLMVATAAGEREALSSPDLEFVQRVDQVLKTAIENAAARQ